MYPNDKMVDLVEQALRSTPHCPACGAHTDAIAMGDRVMLRCSTLDRPRTRVGRIVAALIEQEHVSVPIIDIGVPIAA